MRAVYHMWNRLGTSRKPADGPGRRSRRGERGPLRLFVVVGVGVLAATTGRPAALEVELAGEHVVDHGIDGFEVPIPPQLLPLEFLEGAIDLLVDELAHGHSPCLRDDKTRHVGLDNTHPYMASNFCPDLRAWPASR